MSGIYTVAIRPILPGALPINASLPQAMKLNTKSRIAIKALLDIAASGAHAPVALANLAERQGISLSYLEQMFRRLRTSGLVKSSRGPGGGYQLGKKLSAISVADVVDVVDDESKRKPRAIRNGDQCSADDLWVRIERNILDYLRTVSLESLLPGHSHAVRSLHAVAAGMPDSRDRRIPIAA